ncbi:6-carboxytetrahydropterin synthase QueD [Amphibacillus cookii]|uniref:6-carboxytetrahydropterin synthase QueD n=1 Tax=Amphibacillus cookii TaxID=767787 RepID=UPI001957ADBE|nr:6-carboxytetrahydropterin synthase QueD [Amphibacillus cookii]MBM7541985.1 6-pyruvoyltetrahydropterin/6-carboxytetrahydropterin synthase [Amphibacillus cookii]
MHNYKIVEHLQKFGVDIKHDQLKSHKKRVLVSKAFTFDAAHHLHAYQGKCATLHGHTYKVIFGISGYTNEIGLVIDFGEIKKIWKEQIEIYLDHQYLNESLPTMNTTAENMVVWIYSMMEQALNIQEEGDLQVEFVKLYETPTSYAEARREWM